MDFDCTFLTTVDYEIVGYEVALLRDESPELYSVSLRCRGLTGALEGVTVLITQRDEDYCTAKEAAYTAAADYFEEA